MVCWHFSGVIFAYALLGKEKVKEWQMFFFTAYYASLPFVVGEILSFSMFNLQVCTAMVAVAFGFVSSVRFVEDKRKRDAGYAFLLLLYGFAVYQALICVYVTGVVAYCLLRFVKREERGLLPEAPCAGVPAPEASRPEFPEERSGSGTHFSEDPYRH